MRRVVSVPALLALLVSGVAPASEVPSEPAATAASAAAPVESAATYTLLPAQSHLYVIVRNDPKAFLSRFGHDHAIVAEDFRGTVTWPLTPGAGACRVEITVPVKKLVVDPPGARERAGLDPNATIKDERKPTLLKNMWSADQLDADRHPEITFRSTACPGGTGKVEVAGELTVRGVAKPVTVTMDVSADGTRFAAKGRLALTHAMFGFAPYQLGPTGPRNQEGLDLVVEVKGTVR